MKISGYTTTRNCVEMNYSFVECIKSMLDFCDEVVVADSSTESMYDNTQEILEDLMEKHDNLHVFHIDVDYSAPNHAIWDGKMKAAARAQCTGDYLVQMDADEVFPLGIRQKLEDTISRTLANSPDLPLLALPVVEYWGSSGKVRVDVNPWKWRVSKNLPDLTHGIPMHLRKWEKVDGYEEELLFAMPGTDTCDYIWKSTGQVAPCGHFMTSEVEQVRQHALAGDSNSLALYEQWFNKCVEHLPTVYHFSWWSPAWKIQNYKKFWNTFWKSMYNDHSKPQGWNPFFEQPLEIVSNKQIFLYSDILEKYTGGHIFHTKWDYKVTPSVKINQPVPSIINTWLKTLRDPHKDKENK